MVSLKDQRWSVIDHPEQGLVLVLKVGKSYSATILGEILTDPKKLVKALHMNTHMMQDHLDLKLGLGVSRGR